MITPEPPAGSEHYREGWRHGYEQAAIDRERSADAVRLVPDTGARPAKSSHSVYVRVRNVLRAGLHTEQVTDTVALDWAPCGDEGLLRLVGVEVLDARGAEIDGLDVVTGRAHGTAPDTVQAPESPTDSTPKAGRGGSSEAETATGAVQTPDAPALAYARSEVDKWLADNDPYCILPTRTEHIPALLARLDELEGTR